MKAFISTLNRQIACLLMLLVVAASVQAEDIDIFVGNDTTNSGLPSVLVVLDNTSNWARQSQQWPGGLQQGQAEVRAIKTALAGQVGKVNVGLLEFTTGGTANQDGAFVRFAMQELTEDSYTVLSRRLDTIFDDINGNKEKRNSGTPYGNLMRDVYSYLAGLEQSHGGAGTPDAGGLPAGEVRADPDGYSTQYSLFRSPLSSDNICTNLNVIFVGNPNNSGPSTDSADNSAFLADLYAGVEDTADKLAGQASGSPLPIPLLTTVINTDTEVLGASAQCYQTNNNGVSACTTAESSAGGLCDGVSDCSCSSTPASSSGCASNRYKLNVQSTSTTTTVTPTGEYNTTAGVDWNLDDWAKFLKTYGIPISLPVDDGDPLTTRVEVNMFTVDVFNAQQNSSHSGLLRSAADVGGGSYYAASNEEAIEAAFNDVLSKILSVSSTFAAVTLPLSATNRAQNENEVFIGMFRPDQAAAPRWFGNLKRYQLGLFGNKVELADAQGDQAVNPLSGFATECAESFWSVDSGEYWNDLGITPSPRSQCVSSLNSVWSDLPDGPFVEKGGVAQVTRNSDIAARNLLTVGADGLTAFTSASYAASIGGTSVYNYFRGSSVGVGETSGGSNGRPSIHGDVIHSRPLPINYGDAGTVVYYGSNDGLFRAISTSTGSELWGLVAPEHFSSLQRLYDNSPRVAFPNQDANPDEAAPEPKDYFFDGSIGQIVSYDADNQVDLAYIYPTMRRGGRMVYALNVTDPDAPALLWRRGCPDMDSDVGCDSGFEALGQTWSTPKGAIIKIPDPLNAGQFSDVRVVIFGGGLDACEDTDASVTTCDYAAVNNPSKGNAVYVLNAATGELLKSFATTAGVVADINTVDVNSDGRVDYAYAVDTGGNIWRINFADPVTEPLTAQAIDDWAITKVAYTQGGSRKFMNAPALLPYLGKVYLALGSGNRERPLESNYPYVDEVDDRFYVVLDYPASDAAVDLDGQLMNNATAEPNCDADGIYPGTEQRGWFMSMPGRGEQIVNPAAIAGDVLFNSYQPGGTQVGLCTRPLGVAKGYAMSLFNGSACGRNRSEVITGGGMPIAPTISTVSVLKDPDCVGASCETETVTVCIGCEGLKPTEIKPTLDDTRRRIYWNSEVDR
nr:PilC/PilY family type IV pilus protein [uncultured Pseudomonas sp.]